MIDSLSAAPQPSEPRPFHPPHTAEMRLPNGMRVIVAPRRGIPLIGAQIVFNVGAASDPAEEAGLSYLAASLLSYGPEHSTSTKFSEALDAIGARFSGAAGHDAISAGVSSMTSLFSDALQLSTEALRQPSFASEDLERVRARTLSDLRLSYGSASSLARIVMSKALYGALPYGQPVSGTPITITAVTRESIVKLARTRLRPETATVVLSGDFDVDAGFAYAQRGFGDWEGPSYVRVDTPPAAFDPTALPRGRAILVDMPDSGRSAIVLGRVTIPRRHPQYAQALVTMALLAGYSGRLNYEVRVKRGLSYGAAPSMQARREAGPFVASTLVDHTRAAEAVDVMLDVMRSIVERPPTLAELAPRKAMLRGSFGRGLETVGGLASSLAELALNELPLSEYDVYLDRIEAVTPEEVAAFARDYLIDAQTVVIVGDANIVAESLRERFPQLELISATSFDVERL